VNRSWTCPPSWPRERGCSTPAQSRPAPRRGLPDPHQQPRTRLPPTQACRIEDSGRSAASAEAPAQRHNLPPLTQDHQTLLAATAACPATDRRGRREGLRPRTDPGVARRGWDRRGRAHAPDRGRASPPQPPPRPAAGMRTRTPSRHRRADQRGSAGPRPQPGAQGPPAPVPVPSGNTTRHRLTRGGNRQLNRALFTVAMVQARWHPDARAYLARKRAEGETGAEARRCLKRHLAATTNRAMIKDALGPGPRTRRGFTRAAPDRDALIRPVGAVLAERRDECAEGRGYLGLEVLERARLSTVLEISGATSTEEVKTGTTRAFSAGPSRKIGRSRRTPCPGTRAGPETTPATAPESPPKGRRRGSPYCHRRRGTAPRSFDRRRGDRRHPGQQPCVEGESGRRRVPGQHA
jgi:hypothetical protein